ncbi:MAG TPA: hypothetical protein VLF93_01740 [Candidatus Saccharimonadales bacterium]|nr:hypothetical protein [Candidatus Saccharimonadales bacterium]
MKKVLIIIGIIVIVAVGGYLGRHKIKAMFGGSSDQQVMQTSQPTKASAQAAMAPSDNIYLTKTDPTKGKYLTDFQGITLYIFDKDTQGKSNCEAACAKAWPPYSSGATAQSTFPTNIAVITRSDGSKQFTWKGMPLYYFASDTKAGDLMGDGVGGIWHIVKP